jgi:lysophospholipase L1-like esterase
VRLAEWDFEMRLIVLACSVCLVGCYSLQAQDQPSDAATNSDAVAEQDDILAPFRDAAVKRWEKSMVEFDAQNAAESDPTDAVLFIGSSSIRRWESMTTDMSPYRTIRRGYGGAKFTDMAIFVDRVIQPHQYRALVMFVGNGVVGKPEDHSPDLIEALARKIVAASHSHQPEAPVLLIEITPCGKRYDAWPKIRAVNARLREVSLSTPNAYFIPTAGHYLRPDGTPREELFVEDRLHLNETGYQLWATLIRKRLDDVFRLMADTQRTTP